MKTPQNELRQFYNFNLNNNIPVVYIKDDKLEKPLFYLAVSVGYFSDPESHPGLAHFLEHLIFMGSEKYPKENHFNDVLAKYQGMTNAYTDTDKTVYYFNSLSSGFEEIIDIFYNLIKCPLLSKSSQEREVLAVDSEHEKNVLNDMWRLFRLIGLMSNENHPLFKFGTGNLETLNNETAIKKVKEFHQEFYHSNNFYICLADNKSEEYYKNFLNSNFGSLTTYLSKNIYKLEKPFKSDIQNYYLPSENNNKKLHLIWNLNKLKLNENPIGLINELSTNMRAKTLQKVLIELDYVKNIKFNIDDIKDDYMIIILVINLTDKGTKNIQKIISIVNNYFKFLEKQNITNLLKEYQKKNIINFNYEANDDSMDLTSDIIVNMFETDEPLFYNYDFSNVNQENYLNVLNELKKESNKILLLSEEKFNETGLEKIKKLDEKYYKMEYFRLKDIEMLDELELDFEIPNNNKYLLEPVLVENNLLTKLQVEGHNYYRFNEDWKTPMVFSTVLIDFPYFEKDFLAIQQFLYVLSYQIKEKYYDALLLGYSISLTPNSSKNILLLNISGYNSNVNDLIKEILEDIKELPNLEKYINLVNMEYKQILEKYKTKSPFHLITDIFKNEILPNYKTDQELFENYENLSIKKYNKFINYILENRKNFYLYGNYQKKLSSKNNFDLIIQKNNTPNNLTFKHPNKKEKNKSILINYFIGKYQIKNQAFIKVINSKMSDDFFDVLRTKHQLGYLVKQYYRNYNNDLYLCQHIQTQEDLNKVENLVKEFNNNFIEDLSKLNDIEFEEIKNNVIKDVLKPYENMEEQYYEDLDEILTNKLQFNRKELLAKEIKLINLKDLINFLKLIIKNKNIIKIN